MRRRTFLGGSVAIVADPLLSPDAGAEQPTKRPVIGFLIPTDRSQSEPSVAAFREGLRETGYVEAQNVAIEYRWAEGRLDQLPALAADLVGRRLDAHLEVPQIVQAMDLALAVDVAKPHRAEPQSVGTLDLRVDLRGTPPTTAGSASAFSR